MNNKKTNNRLLGEELIKSAINFDEALAEILKIEVKRLKKLAKNSNELEELQKTNKLIKSIILAFIITDGKIKTGIDLCMNRDETEINKSS